MLRVSDYLIFCVTFRPVEKINKKTSLELLNFKLVFLLLTGNLVSEVADPEDQHRLDRSEDTDQQDRIALGQDNEEQEKEP